MRIAIVTCGYGTAYYDPETHDCLIEAYASIDQIIEGDWSEYDGILDPKLHQDFGLPQDFNTYRLEEDECGRRTYSLLS